MQVTRVGLDLAKRVFQVHGVDAHGKTKLSKRLARGEMLQFFAQVTGGTRWSRKFPLSAGM